MILKFEGVAIVFLRVLKECMCICDIENSGEKRNS